jgi:hypothetical protein
MSTIISASPTLLQGSAPSPPLRALKVGDFFIQASRVSRYAAALVLTGLVSTAHAGEYAPQECDFSELGTVESVRQAPIVELLPNVFEHPLRPESVNELVIQVDDGREVILRDESMQRFVAGERVRLEPSSRQPRVEHK